MWSMFTKETELVSEARYFPTILTPLPSVTVLGEPLRTGIAVASHLSCSDVQWRKTPDAKRFYEDPHTSVEERHLRQSLSNGKFLVRWKKSINLLS
jgi:hypothetical protein